MKRLFGIAALSALLAPAAAHGTPVVFLHPKEMGGVLIELMETPKEAH